MEEYRSVEDASWTKESEKVRTRICVLRKDGEKVRILEVTQMSSKKWFHDNNKTLSSINIFWASTTFTSFPQCYNPKVFQYYTSIPWKCQSDDEKHVACAWNPSFARDVTKRFIPHSTEGLIFTACYFLLRQNHAGDFNIKHGPIPLTTSTWGNKLQKLWRVKQNNSILTTKVWRITSVTCAVV